MKFSVKREDLISVLGEYTNILKENQIKPVLAGLKIFTQKDSIVFIGLNTEVELIKKIDATIETDGSVIIKPALLLEYIKLVDTEIINFFLDEGYLSVENAKLSILIDEFPKIKELQGKRLLTISGSRLINLLEKVKFAAFQTPENIQFNCVRFIFKKDQLNLVTTDSFRLLFLKDVVCCNEETEISVPLETVNTLCKLLKDYHEPITIELFDNTLIVNWKNSYFSSKTTAFQYPDFRALLRNSSFSKKMEFNRDELKSSLKRVLTVAKTSIDAKNGATFNFSGKTLLLSSFSGKAKITQKVEMIKEGEDFMASLNCKFLNDYLENISKNVVISGNNSTSMFHIQELNNENYTYILMPLALIR